METIEISSRQQDVGKEWDETDRNILISAVAGSGKTTTLMMLLESCKHRTLILAFNKSIQKEFEQRMSQRNLVQGKAMTMHSLGLQFLRKAGIKFRIENGKNWNIIKRLRSEFRRDVAKVEYSERSKLMYSLTEMNDVSRMYLTDDLEEIKRYMVNMDKLLSVTIHLGTLWEAFVAIREDMDSQSVIDIDFLDITDRFSSISDGCLGRVIKTFFGLCEYFNDFHHGHGFSFHA